ncbi:hypothetical protein B0H16DRAFT_1744795 [Mycena metata]|uniref:Secreted protein n=1 Tax=Mycena metata TaxID=1033252 RepID=A0AAD7MDW8_9AGAR|nr:hypothetical protein B0H16DRAFT_1744795 [Mycena metata]
MRLWAVLWPLLVAILLSLDIMSPPSPSSSLAQRRERGIRQARVYANIAPYRSPRRQPGVLPLRDIQNVPPVQHGSDIEQRRSVQRDADRERQLALQETPSRRRCRIPEARDENRAPSPTPLMRRPIPQPVFPGVGTPPATQQRNRCDVSGNGGLLPLHQRFLRLRHLLKLLQLDARLRSGLGANRRAHNQLLQLALPHVHQHRALLFPMQLALARNAHQYRGLHLDVNPPHPLIRPLRVVVIVPPRFLLLDVPIGSRQDATTWAEWM